MDSEATLKRIDGRRSTEKRKVHKVGPSSVRVSSSTVIESTTIHRSNSRIVANWRNVSWAFGCRSTQVDPPSSSPLQMGELLDLVMWNDDQDDEYDDSENFVEDEDSDEEFESFMAKIDQERAAKGMKNLRGTKEKKDTPQSKQESSSRLFSASSLRFNTMVRISSRKMMNERSCSTSSRMEEGMDDKMERAFHGIMDDDNVTESCESGYSSQPSQPISRLSTNENFWDEVF